MLVTLRPLATIRPYARNPRVNDAAVNAVAASIQQFGFRQPIVVDPDGVIVAGHTRYKAALQLGLTEVPVHVADLGPAQATAYRLADNKTRDLSTWDAQLLPLELKDLQELGIDIDAFGFGFDHQELIDRPPGESPGTSPWSRVPSEQPRPGNFRIGEFAGTISDEHYARLAIIIGQQSPATVLQELIDAHSDR